MVYDNIKNLDDVIDDPHMYENLGLDDIGVHVLYARLKKASEILKNEKLINQPARKERYTIEGINADEIHYFIQEYPTKKQEDCKLETHDRYIDIQFVVNGKEAIGCAPRKGLTEIIPEGKDKAYDEENDRTFYRVPENMRYDLLSAGDFGIYLPQDAHMPKKMYGKEPSQVHKVVVKVKIAA